MNTTARKSTWKELLFVPVAAGSLLMLSACGSGTDDTPDSPEPDTTQDSDATDETDPAPTSDEDTGSDEADEEQGSSVGSFSMDLVEENDSAESCWAVMDGTVYDLTDWIDEHPGGAERIEGLCGTDAAEAFEGQHGGSEGPEQQLAEFEIGTLEE